MRKHNFISHSYLRNIEKRDRQIYFSSILILLTLNLLIYQKLSYKKSELEQASSRPVINYSKEEVIKEEPEVIIFTLHRKISGYLGNNISLKEFSYDESKVTVTISSKNKTDCINFIKNVEDDNRFFIERLSKIELVGAEYRLTAELLLKGGEQS